MRGLAIIGALIGLMGTAQAQDPAPPDRGTLALIAGYKALFSCAGQFDSGRSLAAIKEGELARIYPGYRAALATLPDPVTVSDPAHTSVAFADDMPPRIAAWRPHFGCTLLPTGADTAFIAALPSLETAPRAAPRPDTPWPAGDAVPERAVTDGLQTVLNTAFDAETYGAGTATTAVIVADADGLLGEQYRDDFGPYTPQRTWSVAKSITASIIGAAVHEGLIDIESPAGLPEWSAPGDPRAEITFTHLLHMASGLDAGPVGSRTDETYFGGGLIADHAGRGSLIAQPGTRWFYANNDTMLVMRALAQRFETRDAYWAWVQSVLTRLNMGHTTLGADWAGDYVLSSQVWTTARDLARLGQAYLNDGAVDGTRIFAPGWTEFVRAPAPAQPPLARANGTPLPGYGAQFWLFGARHGLPDGSYAAMGHRGQYVVVIPARTIVIVRRGFDESGGTQFNIAGFAADVLSALDED